ncbi:CUB domain-containing protein [Candidatus Thioglobus sp.]|uniref:CUB domain-containing protein n=1 Tax=Candidatus Thioglobus sp. TaxID=2026721 RepID=UPI00345C1C40
MGTYCGDTNPDKIVSSKSEMLVVFTSDYMIEGKGFLAEVIFNTNIEELETETTDKGTDISML